MIGKASTERAHPTRSDSQYAREREVFKYLPNWAKRSQRSPSADEKPKSGLDVTLNALAQLVALRMQADRACISLIDRTHQYLLAESTKTLSLESDSIHDNGDGLIFGTQSVPCAGGLCEMALQLPVTAVSADGLYGTVEPYVVPDLHTSKDDILKDRQLYWLTHPEVRLFATVAIRSFDGYSIGAICVIDRTPRSTGLSSMQKQFLKDMSITVMKHLEGQRVQADFQRSLKLFKALGYLTQEDATTGPQRRASASPSCFNPGNHDLDRPTRPKTPESHANGLLSPDSFSASGLASVKEEGFLRRRRSFTQMAKTSNNRRTRPLFQRASSLLKEGSGADGVVFFDVSKASVGANKAPVPPARIDVHKATDRDDLSMDPQDTTARTDACSLLNTSEEPISCDILGFSLSTESSAKEEVPVSIPINEDTLHDLLDRFKHGTVMQINDNGTITSPDSGRSARVLPSLRPRSSHAASLNASGEHRDRALQSILDLLPSGTQARSVAFVPLWDFQRQRWYAAGIIWSCDHKVRLYLDNDLNYLKAFGNCLMAAVVRQDALLSESQQANFLSMLSHELRTPLHGILANVESLREVKTGCLEGSLIDTIEACGRTMLDVIDHLLDYTTTLAKPEGGSPGNRSGNAPDTAEQLQLSFPRTNSADIVDLSVVLEEAIASLMSARDLQRDVLLGYERRTLLGPLHRSSETVANHPALLYDIEPRTSWWIRTNSGAFRRIVMNLVSNSLKFTPKGRITVALRMQSLPEPHKVSRVVLTISDSGCGMSERYLKYELYSHFRQENTHVVGTGLGLSIVRHMVAQLHGSTSVQSKQGVGTCVTVTFPVEEVGDRATPPAGGMGEGEGDDCGNINSISKRSRGLKVTFVEPRNAFSNVEDPVQRQAMLQEAKLYRDYITHMALKWFGMHLSFTDSWDWSAADIFLVDESCLGATSVGDVTNHLPFVTEAATPENLHAKPVIIAGGSVHLTKLYASIEASANCSVYFLAKPCGPNHFARVMDQCLAALRSSDEQRIMHQETAQESARSRIPAMKQDYPAQPAAHAQAQQQRKEAQAGQKGSASPDDIRSSGKNTPEINGMTDQECDKYSEGRKSARPRVLLVDDNAVNLRILERITRKLDLQYDCAVNGKEAVDKFEKSEQSFDIIWMDINMPIMDGIEATRVIRASEKQSQKQRCTILALTGLSSPNDQEEAKASGMDYVITKPISLAKLKETIEQWRQRQEARAETSGDSGGANAP